MSSSREDLGPWAEAAHAFGLDHPALLRSPGARKIAEEAHRVHEVRRGTLGRILDLENLLNVAREQYDSATVSGLDVLHQLHAELERQPDVMQAAVSGLALSLAAHDDGADSADGLDIETPITRETLIEQHGIEAQFEALLDMFTMQGLYNPRPRTVQVHGRGEGPAIELPPFERLAEIVMTDSICRYLARADSIQLVLTPLADSRVIKSIGKIIGFSDYTVVNTEERSGATSFVGRPMSPPEYMMLQALRQREGEPLLDEAAGSGSGTETWFPGHHLTDSAGTIVSRKMGHSVRFRIDQVGRGSENRGYRMTYAPAA